MRLHVREWGSTGNRQALLIHGIMSDSRTWGRVAPLLVARGYRVLAVDLRGHGQSPTGEYSPQAWADDLVDTLPKGADLAIGHSLGGLTLSLAVAELKPARAVYSDPAWLIGADTDPASFAPLKNSTRADIAARSPRWIGEDIDVELATLADWDPATAFALTPSSDYTPAHPAVPSLVQLADGSWLVPPDRARKLRERGFEVRTVPGAGHTIHRDDLDGFLSSLQGWI